MDKGDEERERDREKKEVQQDDANFVFVSFFSSIQYLSTYAQFLLPRGG